MVGSLSMRVDTPASHLYEAAGSTSEHSPSCSPHAGATVRATPGFQRWLMMQWLHPDGQAAPLTATMKAFRQSQTSARQEELRSDLVFAALNHEPAKRSNEHVATIARYLCGSQDVAFAASMPSELLRHICAGAEMALVEDGDALRASPLLRYILYCRARSSSVKQFLERRGR